MAFQLKNYRVFPKAPSTLWTWRSCVYTTAVRLAGGIRAQDSDHFVHVYVSVCRMGMCVWVCVSICVGVVAV